VLSAVEDVAILLSKNLALVLVHGAPEATPGCVAQDIVDIATASCITSTVNAFVGTFVSAFVGTFVGAFVGTFVSAFVGTFVGALGFVGE
jgi:hypothetical protein